jgi:hypothetical protein
VLLSVTFTDLGFISSPNSSCGTEITEHELCKILYCLFKLVAPKLKNGSVLPDDLGSFGLLLNLS